MIALIYGIAIVSSFTLGLFGFFVGRCRPMPLSLFLIMLRL